MTEEIALPEALTLLGITVPQLEAAGLDPAQMVDIFSKSNSDRFLALKLFPELKDKTDPMSIMKLIDTMQAILAFRRTECAVFTKGVIQRDVSMAKLRTEIKAVKAENQRIVDQANRQVYESSAKLNAANDALAQASARAGIFASQDKKDLETSRAHIKELKAQLEGIVGTMQGQIALIRKLEEDRDFAQLQVREAEAHGRTALERLEDRYPQPEKAPFYGTIITELKLLLGGLPQ